MKIRFLSLAILAIAATGTLSAQEVSAQEGQRPGARFQFAPQVYRMEQPRMPKGYGAAPAPSVAAGSVPSSSMLGLDPSVLQRPQPQVAARPAANHVAGQAFIPKAVPQVAFNPAFGSAAPIQPPMQSPAMAAPAQPMARAAAPKAAARPAGRRSHVKTGVSGKLKTPIRHSTPAMVASYGPGFGYTPGGHLPSQSGGSVSARTSVSGQVLRQK
jgi:hypothetical protein